MQHSNHKPFVCVCAVLMFIAVTVVRADPPRIRNLTYDTQNKLWVETPAPQPGTSAGDLYTAREHLKATRFRAAQRAVERVIKKYGETDPEFAGALLVRAEVRIGRKKYEKAHLVLQEFLSRFGGSALTSEALRLEFVVADAFLSGAKRKIFGLWPVSGKDLAYKILDEISVDYPDSRYAQLAVKTKADHLFADGEHDLAELEYARLLRDYPTSQYHQFSMRRSAEAVLARYGGIDYDEGALIEADGRYRDYALSYPGVAQREGVDLVLDTIRESHAEKHFSIGQYYERTNHLSSAVYYYRIVLEDWAGTFAAQKALGRLELLGAGDVASRSINDNAHGSGTR